jgi:DNA-binding transcriptional regulator YiaG
MNDIPELTDEDAKRLRRSVDWVDGQHLEYFGRTAGGNSGVISIQGTPLTVRRVIWRHANGPIPDGHYVHRKCDHDGCVHPAHLSISKSRVTGLTDKDIREIRRQYANGSVTYDDLSEEHDVSSSYIGMIVRYDTRVDAGPAPESETGRKISQRGSIYIYNGEAGPRNLRPESEKRRRDDGTLKIPSLTKEVVREEILRRTSETESGCLIFRGKINSDGYGRVSIGGTSFRAHRVVYEIISGPIPINHQIHHSCETKACVNPDHLHSLNPKGHAAAHNPDSPNDNRKKLTQEEVEEMRQASENTDLSYSDLASHYGVSRGYVGRIVRKEVRPGPEQT